MNFKRFLSKLTAFCLVTISFTVLASTVSAALPDYLKLTELLATLKAKPELFATTDADRIAFCGAQQFKATVDDIRRNGAISSADKLAAIKWLTSFAFEQGLFADEDLAAILSKLNSMSDADAQKWHRGVVNVRVLADTPEWQVTSQWMNQFWDVQAMYKDYQIKEFRRTLTKLTPSGVRFVMEHMVEVLGKRLQRQQVVAARRQSYQFAPSSTVQRNTSGSPTYTQGTPQQTIRRPIRSRSGFGSDLSRRISDYYIYRGSVLY